MPEMILRASPLSGASLRIGMARYSYYVLGRKRIGISVLRITYHWPGPNLVRARLKPGAACGWMEVMQKTVAEIGCVQLLSVTCLCYLSVFSN